MNMTPVISNYAKKMTELPYSFGPRAWIYVKEEGKCLKTVDTADFHNVTEDDLVDATHFDAPEKDILLARKDLGAMIFFRTPFVGRCLDEGRPIIAGIDDMTMIVGQEIPVVKRDRKELEKALKETDAVLVDDGGDGYAVTFGRTLYEAYVAMMVLEKGAEIMIKGEVLGGIKPVNKTIAKLERTVYKTKYSKAESKRKAAEESGSAEEPEIVEDMESDTLPEAEADTEAESGIEAAADEIASREPLDYPGADSVMARGSKESDLYRYGDLAVAADIIEYGRKLLAEDLVQGTWGNLSARFGRIHMLVTPSGLDYEELTPDDLVLVDTLILEYEGDKKPTSEKSLHAGIYNLFPEAGAVIHTHSRYCSIFAACHMPLEVEDPELAKELGDFLPIADYGLSGSKKLTNNILSAISADYAGGKARGCLMSNHGMVCWGKDLADAFDFCRKMEQAARETVERRFAAKDAE